MRLPLAASDSSRRSAPRAHRSAVRSSATSSRRRSHHLHTSPAAVRDSDRVPSDFESYSRVEAFKIACQHDLHSCRRPLQLAPPADEFLVGAAEFHVGFERHESYPCARDIEVRAWQSAFRHGSVVEVLALEHLQTVYFAVRRMNSAEISKTSGC